MNEKRFSIAFVTVFFLLAAVIYVAIWWTPEMKYMDGEYPYWIQQRDYVHTDSNRQEILLLGDSTVKAGIRAAEFHPNAYNLALGGGTSIEMYYTLEDYLKHHPAPRMVILAFLPGHYRTVGAYWFRDTYFHYLDATRYMEVDWHMLRLDNHCDIGFTIETLLRSPRVYAKQVLGSFRHSHEKENRETYERASENRGRFFVAERSEDIDLPEANEPAFRPMKIETYYLGRLIELCQAKGIELHIEQTPVKIRGLNKMEASGYLRSYRDYMQQIANDYGVDVNPIIPGYDSRYFCDDAHLNDAGAERFTQELREKYFGRKEVGP